jgi:tRNA-2-methylthio-N6-dimethylallyladenosine synthase
MKYFIQTYGCQMNYSDSERVASVLEGLGMEEASSDKDADVLILTTCSVKQKAEDRVLGLRKYFKQLKKQKSHLLIGLTGCMSRTTSTRKLSKPDSLLRRMPEMDFVFKIDDLAKLPQLLQELQLKIAVSAPESKFTEGSLENYFKITPKKSSTAQVFVPIMTGCDKFCTYCIVPYARGREKSRDFDEVLDECKRHVQEGALEITLVGQTVNSYGLSFQDKKSGKFENLEKSPFAELLREVDKLKSCGLRRLRFTSPHPRDFTDELIQTLAQLKTICPHMHMPVQSGDDDILRRMNRNYKVEEFKEILQKLRTAIPGCAITTDIIVGFCGETDQEFENTYKMYEELQWDLCFLSRYSPRKGTYAHRKLEDDIPAKTKAARWHRLNDLLVKIMEKKHTAFLGQTLEVLVEKQTENPNGSGQINGQGQTCSGRTPHYKEVFFQAPLDASGKSKNLIGQIVPVKITAARTLHLEGKLD